MSFKLENNMYIARSNYDLKLLVNKEGIQKLGAKGIVEIDNQLKIILGPNSKQLKKYMADLK